MRQAFGACAQYNSIIMSPTVVCSTTVGASSSPSCNSELLAITYESVGERWASGHGRVLSISHILPKWIIVENLRKLCLRPTASQHVAKVKSELENVNHGPQTKAVASPKC